jgi:hypothetical protein
MPSESLPNLIMRSAKQGLQAVLWIIVALSLTQCSNLAVGFSSNSPSSNSSTTKSSQRKWNGKEFDRVVGYQFKDLPGVVPIAANDLGKLDMESLQKVKLKEAVLSDSQVEELFQAIFSTASSLPVFNCYDPHHIFIFYTGEKPIGAFEVCFICHGTRTWPKANMKITESYPMLRKLCSELGLGFSRPSNSSL